MLHDHVLGPLIEFSAPEEKRAFYFFENVTAPCISGDFDASFWRVIVLQICQTEPAVRHAVLAVSSLHESLGARSTTQAFALQQYNKAITRLLDQMNNPLAKPLASLLTCVLFVCIEYMQGKDKESLIHLEQGRQLLTRLDQRSSAPEMECIVRHIVPLYTRLSLTSFLFGGSPVPIPDSLKSRAQKEVPDLFDSIDAVRRCMDEFMERAFRFTQMAQPAKNSSDAIPRETMRLLEVEQDCLLARHAKLNVAFTLYRASKTKPFQMHLHAMLVIQMYLHAQHIWISTALSSSEVVYDDFLSSFAAIVPLAAAYLDLEPPPKSHQPGVVPPSQHSQQDHPPMSGGPGAGGPSSQQRYCHPQGMEQQQQQIPTAHATDFTFETHIIPPLYYVATKCRHPLIRRSALDLLRRNPYRRENLWRASAMGALAGHIVSLEEGWAQGAQGDNKNINTEKPQSHEQHHSGHNESKSDYGHYTTITTENANPNVNMVSTSSGTTMPVVSLENIDIDLDLDLHAPPVDPSLFTDVEILSYAPSLEDEYSSTGAMEFLTPPTARYLYPHRPQSLGDHQQYDYSSHSPGSSDLSSLDAEEEQARMRYYQHHQQGSQQHQPMMAPHYGASTFQPEHQRRNMGQDEHSDYYETGVGGTLHYQHLSQAPAPTTPPQHELPSSSRVPCHIPTEAPYGLPEELRVHDAVIIGPTSDDGSWVAIFRKLHTGSDWDVQQDWVAMV